MSEAFFRLAVLYVLGLFSGAVVAERQVIGLYIGIADYSNPYEDISLVRLNDAGEDDGIHRTNERVILPLMRDRFGVRWMPSLLDGDATRDRIRESLRGLIARAEAITTAGDEVTVVLFYTGHGSQVKDDDGDEADDHLDETLVTVHSSIDEGEYDIRDDDLAAFRHRIGSLGGELVMFVEACHSETAFRGPPDLSMHRVGEIDGSDERLFPELAEHYEAVRAADGDVAKLFDGSPTERFVCFSAVADDGLARWDTIGGVYWGYFSYALAKALETLPPRSTYRDLYAAILREFDRRFPDMTAQRPALHPGSAWFDEAGLHSGTGTTDHSGVEFLGGRYRVPHARITSGTDGVIRLDRGSAIGFGVGARVAVFASIDALERGTPPLRTGEVAEASLTESVVHLGLALPDHAVATLVTPSGDPARLYISPRVDAEFAAAVRRQAARRSIEIASALGEGALALDTAEHGGGVGLYPIADVSAMHDAEPPRGDPLYSFDVSEPLADLIVVQHAGALMRSREFWNATGGAAQLSIRLLRDDGTEITPDADGVVRVAHCDLVRFRFENGSDRDLQLTVFASSDYGAGMLCFDQIVKDTAIAARGLYTTPTLYAMVEADAACPVPESELGLERTSLVRVKAMLSPRGSGNLAQALSPRSHRDPSSTAESAHTARADEGTASLVVEIVQAKK